MEITKKETNDPHKRSLGYSIKDGAAYAVMESSGSAYVAPFALACNASNIFVGLLSSMPLLVSNLFQLKTPKLMEKYSRKIIVMRYVLLQALMWLPMILLTFLNVKSQYSLPLLLLFYITLFSFNAATVPAWNSWMKDLVRDNENGRFFGKRNSIAVFAGISALLIAGFALDIFKKNNAVFLGFAFLFGIAFIARLISLSYLKKQQEPAFELKDGYYFTFFEFVKKMLFNNFGRFTVYVALFHFSVNIAAPFFAVYMLRHLNFTYTAYTSVIIAMPFGLVIGMPLWGKVNDRYGSLFSLRISGFLIPLIPALWLFSTNVYYLIAVEFLSGIVWAAFNLSTQNFIYHAVSKERISLCISYLNVIQTVLVFIGAMIGGLLSTRVTFGLNPILALFIISASARLMVSIVLLPKLREVKTVKNFELRDFSKAVITNIFGR